MLSLTPPKKGVKMRKILNEKAYDTDTATLLGQWKTPGFSVTDHWFARESLYRTPRGNFFLHGEGGGFTEWRGKTGNLRSFGEGILPLSPEEARAWAEKKLDDDDRQDVAWALS